MKKLIVIADWVDDSLRCQELRTIVEGYVNNPSHPTISFMASSHSSIHAGFLANQIALIEERFGRPLETVILLDIPSDNTELFIARLKTGLYIVGPNSGNVFSFIKSSAEEIFHYQDIEKENRFRKRDIYYRVVAHLLESLQDDLDLDEIHTNLIPELDFFVIGHIDNYGNIKTSIPEAILQEKHHYGDILEVSINGISKSVKYSSSLSENEDGDIVMYPGSAGALQDYYMDIAVYTDFTSVSSTTAVREFDRPSPGTIIELKI
ncbi:hypothetical protein BH09PAT2_BH09PAT2_08970 [soil metagenome]